MILMVCSLHLTTDYNLKWHIDEFFLKADITMLKEL